MYHLMKEKKKKKKANCNNNTTTTKLLFFTTLETDSQTFTYSFMARTIAVGPFSLSCFQAHVTSLGCFMYPVEKLYSANACFQIYI